MNKKMHPGVDQELIGKMNRHADVAKAGFVNDFSVADAIKQDAEDGFQIDENLVKDPPAEKQLQEADEEAMPEEEYSAPSPEEIIAPEFDEPPEDPAARLEWAFGKMKEGFESYPELQKLRQWKAHHGDIFVCNFVDRLFVYRYLKRIEWTNMQRRTRMDQMTEEQFEHLFINKCLLFPTVTENFLENLPAGLVTALAKQIQMNSGFVNPEYLSQFTVKL